MNGKRWWLICAALFLMSFSAAASEAYPSLTEAADSAPRRGKFIDRLYQCVKKFSQIDTTYIEQQKYNFTVMLYNSNTYERYTLKSKDGQRVTFSPDMSYRVGPYFGWRWICLGYTIDLRHVSLSSDHSTKKEFDMSFYSNQIGLDLFYRRSGNDYKVKRMTVGDGEEVEAMNRVGFDGIQVGITGFNLYYIFNHKKFSYPAAYSQSTIQRRSAGSPLVGIGYTHHSLKLDAPKLARLVHEKTLGEVALDSSFYFDKNQVLRHFRQWRIRLQLGVRAQLAFRRVAFAGTGLQTIREASHPTFSRISRFIISTLTVWAVLPWSGTIPSGMRARVPSSIPTITINQDSISVTFSVH